ncbi:ornithine carbamoyltransferase [Candidatus Altiarchaeota archaeon]
MPEIKALEMNLLSISDLDKKVLEKLLEEAEKVKKQPGAYTKSLEGKTLGMIFEKPSTRTRISFEVAMYQLGGYALHLSPNEMQLGRGETIADSARVLSRYLDGLMARVYDHKTLEELAANASIPVISGLSDLEHPCQIIADLFTIKEEVGKLEGVKVAYIGDGNNVCNSLILGCALTGVELSVAAPKGYEPNQEFLKKAKNITVTNDPSQVAKDADFIYTDVWVSMGDEAQEKKRMEDLKGFQVNKELLSNASPDCKILHCLPAHRGQEITDEVIDSKQSIVWNQAENRLHTQKAILKELLG